MTEKESAGSPTEEISDLGRRNRAIDGQPDREDDRGDDEPSHDPRIDRLEQAIVRIESVLEQIHEQQTAPATEDVRPELARLAGRLDAIEALGARRPGGSQERTGRVRPSAADVGLHQLAELVRRRRTAAGRGRGFMAGIGTMLDLHGQESTAGLLAVYRQARNRAPEGRRR
jgi:hypothetical protein